MNVVKVCVVVENHRSAVMGGAQYQGELLAEELARHPGAQVTYIARRADETRCKAQGTPYAIRRIGRLGGIRNRAVFFDAGDLWRAFKEIAPDVVYQQMRQSYTAVCASYARRAGVPFFFHIASDQDLNPSWFPRRLISRRLPFHVVEAAAGIWGMKHASHVIAQTERQARILKERFDRNAAAIVRNFQPLPERLPAKPHDGVVRVFWLANLKDVKRPELFVELAERFAHRADLEFLMAGRPSQLSRHVALLERAASMPNLKYLGELSIDEVEREMARADVHVNTSRFEGFPNTFVQAWANGAVVATVSVDPEEESMEWLGIGYCAGSLARLADLIDRLSRSPEERARVACRAFAFAQERHSMASATALARRMLDAAVEAARPRGLLVRVK